MSSPKLTPVVPKSTPSLSPVVLSSIRFELTRVINVLNTATSLKSFTRTDLLTLEDVRFQLTNIIINLLNTMTYPASSPIINTLLTLQAAVTNLIQQLPHQPELR